MLPSDQRQRTRRSRPVRQQDLFLFAHERRSTPVGRLGCPTTDHARTAGRADDRQFDPDRIGQGPTDGQPPPLQRATPLQPESLRQGRRGQGHAEPHGLSIETEPSAGPG
jgi:hypothetical protein